MKHFVFGTTLIALLLACTSCSGGEKPQPYVPSTSEEEQYIPSEQPDPFPEYVAPTIDTSTFTLDNIPVNFTAVNDFHGQVDEEADDNRVGLAKMSTYLKDRKSKGDILISNGDMYQGSYLAGVDYGQFISHAFKNIGFDAYVIGNHEFDWGMHPLLDNQLAIGQNYLGANIYKYPYTAEKHSLGDEYKIINLYEGTEFEVKVGIIGVIGKSQISSITSTYTPDVVFVEPDILVKNLAVVLREDLNCDYVIASYHDAEPSNSIASKVPDRDYTYVDACFMAHTHQYQKEVINGVPFLQASAYSRGVSSVNFSFNKTSKKSTLVDSKYQYLASLDLEEDPIMKERLDARHEQYLKAYTGIIGVNNAGEISVGQMSQFYAKLVFDENATAYSKTAGLNVVGAFFNESRRSLKAGNITYADLYGTHPFMNEIYIVSITGKDLLNEKKYSYGYLNPSISVKSGQRYDVIVFDYNGFHISVNENYEKFYNYFPSAFAEDATHKPIKVDLLKENYTCVDAAISYLQGQSIENSFFNQEGLFGKIS